MDNREKNFVSAVVYVHDCQDRIGVFLENVLSALSANFAHSELICVNDYSRDGSVDAIRALSPRADALGILTVVVKYLQILVDLVFRRKKYIFESIEKLN